MILCSAKLESQRTPYQESQFGTEDEKLVKELSITKQIPNMDGSPLSSMKSLTGAYGVFGVEPLHLLHLEKSKRVKECTAELFLSGTRYTNLTQHISHLKPFWSIRNKVYREFDLILSVNETFFYSSGFHRDFSINKSRSNRTCFLSIVRIRGMLEGKC